MNILFVCPYAPTAIRTRPYNLLRTLSRRGNQVTLLTLWETTEEEQALKELETEGVTVIARPLTRRRIFRNIARNLVSKSPIQARYSWQPELARDLQAQLSEPGRFDVAHIEHLRGSMYATLAASISASDGTRVPVVWDSVDCISYLFEQATREGVSAKGRMIAALELARTQKLEARLTRSFPRVLVTSAADRQALLDLAARFGAAQAPVPPEQVCVLANGVDLDYFAPRAERRAPATLVFSGKMGYHANVAAASYLVNAVMPLVWAQLPETLVTLVGKDPTVQVRELARANPGRVRVTGFVPDLRPHLATATLAVAPMVYAAGIQNKLLEAMAMATPVVATRGAIAGLDPDAAAALLAADDTAGLAEAIIRLLRDEQLGADLGQRGRKFVEQHHQWNRITAMLEAMYTDVAAHGFEPDRIERH